MESALDTCMVWQEFFKYWKILENTFYTITVKLRKPWTSFRNVENVQNHNLITIAVCLLVSRTLLAYFSQHNNIP